jgi:hypothetical protein
MRGRRTQDILERLDDLVLAAAKGTGRCCAPPKFSSPASRDNGARLVASGLRYITSSAIMM